MGNKNHHFNEVLPTIANSVDVRNVNDRIRNGCMERADRLDIIPETITLLDGSTHLSLSFTCKNCRDGCPNFESVFGF